MIEVGDKVRFRPCIFFERSSRGSNGGLGDIEEVTGTVTYVNYEHNFYRAQYSFHDHILHECFKFE